MKKYKLLKDLPMAVSWTIVEIEKYNWELDTYTIFWFYANQKIELWTIQNRKIKEWLEEILEEPKSVWELKKWDSYWFISNTDIFGDIITDYEEFKVNYLNIGNAFSTQEEARKELNKRKALQRIKKYCHENNIKLFSDKEIKEILEKNVGAHSEVIIFYFIHYKMNFKKFDYSCLSLTRNQECLYFKKEKDIKKVIVNCEKDLKIIFDV